MFYQTIQFHHRWGEEFIAEESSVQKPIVYKSNESLTRVWQKCRFSATDAAVSINPKMLLRQAANRYKPSTLPTDF